MSIAELDRSFHHEAFVYDSDEEYVAALVPYLEAGLRAGDEAIVVVPSRQAALLRAALGARADGVTFIDAVEWYRHPARTVTQYDEVLRRLDGRRARVVGEVQFGATADEWAGWTRYEAALNRALATYDARVVCPYDARVLPPSVVDDARRTHPLLFAVDQGAASSEYVVPEVLAAELVHDLDLPVGAPVVDLDVIRGLGVARQAFAHVATAAGLGVDRVAELTVAVNEVTTNALVHGRGAARLRAWITGPGGVACVVDDDGDGPADPLLGFVPAPSDALGGRGVWLARQLFDRVELARTPTGFRVLLATDPV